MWLYNHSFLSEKREAEGRVSLGARWLCSLKNKLHLNKSSAERNKIIKDWLKAVQSIHSTLFENLSRGESRTTESCEFHEQPLRNSFRLLGASGCAPPEKLACFYHTDNELCNRQGFLFSLVKPNLWSKNSMCASWGLHFTALSLFFLFCPTFL